MSKQDTTVMAASCDWFRRACYGASGFALIASSVLAAQMVTIPFGGPRRERPSPNANLLGAPADIAAAVAAKGRPSAMRNLDDQYHPVDVLTFLGLTRGVRVLVVEQYPGYFGAIIGAAVAPGGNVTELVRRSAMQDPAARSRLSDDISLAPNLSLLTAEPATVRLAPGSLDFVLLHFAYGQLPDAAATGAPQPGVSTFLDTLFVGLRPGGVVGVVESSGVAGDDHASGTAGRDAASVKRDFVHAGFLLDGEGRIRGADDDSGEAPPGASAGGAPSNFILRFRKPE